jgi:NAD(P)-dependent dehydrogenase (short-subunit alcohol dehydrogenase family)
MRAPLAIVTGGSRGIGFEVARQLGLRGYLLIIASKNKKGIDKAARLLTQEGIDVAAKPLDLGSLKSITGFASWALRRGDLDVLVNCAGVMPENDRRHYNGGRGKTVLGATDKAVANSFNVNALGTWRLTRAVAPQLIHGARIVNVSSGMAGLAEMGSGFFGYRASKAAVNVLTVTLAKELAERGIMVNSVCPGWVRTGMGGDDAPRSIKEGAAGIVWAATLEPGGPTGGFFRDEKPLAW